MIRFKKSKVFCCAIKECYKTYRIGDLINVPFGYAKYLSKQGVAIILSQGSNAENVVKSRIMKTLDKEHDLLKSTSSLVIQRKTKKGSEELFQNITLPQIMNLVCKKHNINNYNCFVVKMNDLSTVISRVGEYPCSIWFKEEKIATFNVIILSINNSTK